MPGRCTRWMRQRNEIESCSGPLDAKTATDNLIKFSDRNELRDGQFPDRNDEARLQDFELAIQPRGAVLDLLRVGNPVAPARRFARKTTTDRGEIDFRTHGFFRLGRWLPQTSGRASCPRSRQKVCRRPARALRAPGRPAALRSAPRRRKQAADASTDIAGNCAVARHAARAAPVFPSRAAISPNDEKATRSRSRRC